MFFINLNVKDVKWKVSLMIETELLALFVRKSLFVLYHLTLCILVVGLLICINHL